MMDGALMHLISSVVNGNLHLSTGWVTPSSTRLSLLPCPSWSIALPGGQNKQMRQVQVHSLIPQSQKTNGHNLIDAHRYWTGFPFDFAGI
jgi:hypothetical protein